MASDKLLLGTPLAEGWSFDRDSEFGPISTASVPPERASSAPPKRPEVGAIVYLKSGSPPLTVNSIRSGSQTGRQFVSVEWFDGEEVRRDMFDPECLTAEKPAA